MAIRFLETQVEFPWNPRVPRNLIASSDVTVCIYCDCSWADRCAVSVYECVSCILVQEHRDEDVLTDPQVDSSLLDTQITDFEK